MIFLPGPAWTADNASKRFTRVACLADLILISVRPSPHDLHAVGATVDLVEHLGQPLAFVVSGATARTRIAAAAAVALSQHGRVAPVTVHHRTDFAGSMTDGRTVMELFPAGRSAGEIANLWIYVNTLLAKCAGRSAAIVRADAYRAGHGSPKTGRAVSPPRHFSSRKRFSLGVGGRSCRQSLAHRSSAGFPLHER